MASWLSHAEHGSPGPKETLGWVHPKTGHVFQSISPRHSSQASEMGFTGFSDTEINDKAIEAGYTRYYTTRDEIGVHFNKDHLTAPQHAKDTLAYHAQNQKGRMLLADTGVDYYHGTSLKDAHDFIDRVSTKLRKGRKETDYARMKRELGETADSLIMALNEIVKPVKVKFSSMGPSAKRRVFFHGTRAVLGRVRKVQESRADTLIRRALDESPSPDDGHWHSDGGKEKIHHLVRAHRADVDREIRAAGGEYDCITTAKAWARKLHASGVKNVSVVHGRYLGGYSPTWDDTLGDHSWVQHGKHIFDPAAGFSFSDYPNMLRGKYEGDVWDHDPKLWESVPESALDEALSPDEAKKITVKLDPEMLGVDSKYTWYHIHHADHGKIGDFSGHVSDGHLNVQNMGLDKEYLQKQGIDPGRDYGNWWASADVLRDHKIASNHLGVAGIRQITRELKQKHGITSIGSTERVTGTRLKAYARGRRVPRDSIKSFVTKTRKLSEELKEAGWITPHGEFHGLADLDGLHSHWVRDNAAFVNSFGKKHVSDTAHLGHDRDSDEVKDTFASMIHSGWIRKADMESYECRAQDVPRALKHAAEHHRAKVLTLDVHHPDGRIESRRNVMNRFVEERVDSLIQQVLGEATLRPHSDNRPGRARYDIEHDGQRIGNLAVQTVGSAPGLPAGSRAGKLGVKINPEARGSRTLVRDVLRQLRDRHPDLTHVGGFRLSGTRAHWDNDSKKTTDRYTWVKLRDAIR